MEKGGCSWHKCQDDFSCLYPSLFRLAPKSEAFGVAETIFSPFAAFKMQVLYFKSPGTIGITEGKCGLTIFVFRKELGEEKDCASCRRPPGRCALRLSPPSPPIPSFCPILRFLFLTFAASRYLFRGGGIIFVVVLS